MDLTDEQKAAVTSWVEAGAELGDIQSKLKDEFDISLTYLDTRFLLGDLGLELLSDREEDEPEEEEPEEPTANDSEAPVEEDSSDEAQDETAPDDEVEDLDDALGGGNVSVTVDTLAQPHAVVSGKVTFSDGETASWYLDQMGRLGLDPATPGYQPSQPDIATFQMELQNVLRQSGF